jgi:hypothetical protein
VKKTRYFKVACFAVHLTGVFAAGQVTAEPSVRGSVTLETGAVWQARNDVRIPGDSGTQFALDELTGQGPFPFVRLEADYILRGPHEVRVLIAPFEINESGQLAKDTFFVDQTFTAGKGTEATYQFNSYRLTYRYRFYDKHQWQWRVGFTAKVRDAKIALEQNGVFAQDTDVGFVPLLYLRGDWAPFPDWRFVLDFDGSAAPQGRAIDAAIKAYYALSKRWSLGAGYRVLEGGADNDSVYNFAWFNYAILSLKYAF